MRRCATHPAFLVGAVLSVAAIVLLPAQYLIVLPKQDVLLVEGVIPLAMGAVIAASARPTTWWDGVIGGAVTVVGGLAGYELDGAIGPPSWLKLAAAVAFVGMVSAIGVGVARIRFRRLALVPITIAVGIAGMILYAGLDNEEVGAATACTIRGTIDYCADPEYTGLVGRWAAAVEAVLNAVPADVARGADRVVQTRERIRARGAIASPHELWGRKRGTAELALAMDAATWAVGLRDEATPDDDDARYIVAWWLATRAPGAEDALRRESQFLDGISGSGYASPTTGALTNVCWALALLERSDANVDAAIRNRWDDIVRAPRTAVELLDVLDVGVDQPSSDGPCR